MTEKNAAFIVLVDEMISTLSLKINKLTELDSIKHKYEIQFLEYLQSNFTHLGNCSDQILSLIPFYQKEIVSNWDEVANAKVELHKKKQEIEDFKNSIESIQTKETNTQKNKQHLSKQLKDQESNLISNQKSFNTNGKKLDKLNTKVEMLAKFEADSNDKFLNKIFESRNKHQAKKLTRQVCDRRVNSNELSIQIETKQKQIAETSQEIDFQQKELRELQITNINLRKQIQEIIDTINANTGEIQNTEKKIEVQNDTLKKLSLAIVDIANETARQHSIYKKSCVAPLDDSEYENFLEESLELSIDDQYLENILKPEPTLPGIL